MSRSNPSVPRSPARLRENTFSTLRKLTLPIAAAMAFGGCGLITNDRSSAQRGDPAVYVKTQAVGTSARALLSNDLFQNTVVEIQAVQGFAPPQEALNKLQPFLEQTLNKREVVIHVDDPIPVTSARNYSVADVRALEARYRQVDTRKNRVAIYFLFLDQPSVDDQAAGQRMLGQAYQNTSVVVYESTIRDLIAASQTKPSLGVFEATVMAHEIGHVLGLVDNGTPAVQGEHQDPAHPHHCTSATCLMNFSAESVQILAGLTDGTIPKLDSFCLQDLKANGGK